MQSARDKVGVAIALVLLLAALVTAALALFGPNAPTDIWHSRFGPPEDGSWKAMVLDGRPVVRENCVVGIRWGKVVGGSDDCNGWAYQDERPDRNGERKVISTLVDCPETQERRVYRILVYSPTLERRGDRELRLSRAGHAGIFRRCRPNKERTRCVPV